MNDTLFHLTNIRIEISFKSFDELRKILSFYQRNKLYKINIPCKNNLRKDFLLNEVLQKSKPRQLGLYFATSSLIPYHSTDVCLGKISFIKLI